MSTAVHPMLRKVAEALAWQDLSGLRARGIVAEVTPWRAFLPAARAAVQALMEPDEGQYNAGYDATRRYDGYPQFADAGFCLGHAGVIYRAMLRPLVEGDEE